MGGKLEFNKTELLSWKVITEVLLLVDTPVGIAVLHPDGGQYDTLCLITRNAEVILSLNRHGSSAIIKNQSVGSIWEIANADLQAAISKIVDAGKLKPRESPLGKNLFISNLARKIATHLEENLDASASVEWGWVASPDMSEPNQEILKKFSIPDMWKRIGSLIPGAGWQSNIFVLKKNEMPYGAVNMVLTDWMLSPKKRV